MKQERFKKKKEKLESRQKKRLQQQAMKVSKRYCKLVSYKDVSYRAAQVDRTCSVGRFCRF